MGKRPTHRSIHGLLLFPLPFFAADAAPASPGTSGGGWSGCQCTRWTSLQGEKFMLDGRVNNNNHGCGVETAILLDVSGAAPNRVGSI